MTRELFICSPLFGGMCHSTYKNSQLALMHYLAANRVTAHFVDSTNDALVPRARNKLANCALYDGATSILFWDGDQGINLKYLIDLLKSDKEVVAAPCAKKTIDWYAVRQALKRNPDISDEQLEGASAGASGTLCSNRLAYGLDDEPIDLTEAWEMFELGAGILLIKRSAFEKLIAAYPDDWYYESWMEPRGRKFHDFFPCGPDKVRRVYLPEDFGFCRKWRALGGKIYLFPWIKTTHAGTHVYKGNLSDFAESLMEKEESVR